MDGVLSDVTAKAYANLDRLHLRIRSSSSSMGSIHQFHEYVSDSGGLRVHDNPSCNSGNKQVVPKSYKLLLVPGPEGLL